MLFFALAIGTCLVSLFRDSSNDTVVIAAIGLFSITYITELLVLKRNSTYRFPLILGFLIRLVVLFYDIYTDNPLHIPELGKTLTSDMLRFYTAAEEFSRGNVTHYGGLFSRLFGLIFRYTQVSRLWGEFIVILCSLVTLHIGIKIGREMQLSGAKAKLFICLLCFLPNFLILSVIFRREAVISLLLSVSLLYFLKWFNHRRGRWNFILALGAALAASLFHGATGLIAVGYLIAHLIYDPGQKKFVLEFSNLLIVLMFSLGFLFIMSRYGFLFFNKLDSVSGISSISSIRDVGGSSYAKYVGDSKTFRRMLIYTVPRFAYFLFSPFPWQWRGAGDILAFLTSSMLYIIMFLTAIRAMFRRDDNKNAVIVLCMVLLFIVFVFSWGVTNTGTAIRHRDKFIMISCLLITLAHKDSSNRLLRRCSR